MSVSSFNFHNLASFQLRSEAEYAHHFFQQEYGWAASEDRRPIAAIDLHWQHSTFPFFRKEPNSYHIHKLAARWRFEIEISGQQVSIRAAGNRVALTMIHHMLVHPALRYLVSQQGVILLHGAALVKDDSSFIFTGVGGTGKTTTTSLLLDQGAEDWQLHADDFVFLDRQARSFSYLTRAHLYQELLAWVPAIKSRMSFVERSKAYLFNLMLTLSGKHIRWAVRLPLTRLWPNRSEAEQATLAGLLVLERSVSEGVEINEAKDPAQIIDDLIEMNTFEARHFITLLKKSIGTEQSARIISDWRQRERSILQSALNTSYAYRLKLPRFARSDSGAARLIEAELARSFGEAKHS